MSQSFHDFELILINDDPDTVEPNWLNEYFQYGSKFKYIKNEFNLGLAGARNQGIDAAGGQYFTFCDDDDMWYQNHLENIYHYLNRFKSSFLFLYDIHNQKHIGDAIHLSLKEVILDGYTPPVGAQFYLMRHVKSVKYNTTVRSGVDHDLWIRLLPINPSGLIIRGHGVIVGTSDQNRMTTNFSSRAQEINRSLEIWKSQFIYELGNENYISFCGSYLKHLEFREFTVMLSRYGYRAFFQISSLRLITHLIKLSLRRIFDDPRIF
jgi:glycosyltransferase involved in cell wall biosynthesis